MEVNKMQLICMYKAKSNAIIRDTYNLNDLIHSIGDDSIVEQPVSEAAFQKRHI